MKQYFDDLSDGMKSKIRIITIEVNYTRYPEDTYVVTVPILAPQPLNQKPSEKVKYSVAYFQSNNPFGRFIFEYLITD